ncbi:MAG: type II toxin-antitoxin system VapC family toxin [Verrucomicrobiaceae bacterium]|nr:type II toxin-antitoxin system VapC family toxin [Verrucomicrobiaceae bacterium]
MAIKLSLGKLHLQVDYDLIFPDVLDANGFTLLTPTLEHYKQLITLPRYHGDPFDRLMISQARSEGLSMMTCDEKFAEYSMPTVW